MKKISLLYMFMTMLSTVVSAKTLPVDASIVSGKLPNGITYYIKHNDAPRSQASFHLVYNMGALVEEPEEYGLAHFLEHMTFQGTQHFPGRSIVNMLERHGVLFGHDINAVTSENHTIYKLMGVPTDDKLLLDSCMMVMADWAHALTLDDQKIDKERTVIIEEIKMRNTPDFQTQTQWANEMLKGSRYESHDIIGTIEQISSFPAERLRNFYRRWHRPDLAAVVVVGDFDVKEMEQRLRTQLSQVPKADTPCPLKQNDQFCRVADHDTLRYCDAHREGARSRSVIVINRVADTPAELKNTEDYMRLSVIARLFNILAGKRAKAKSMDQGSPFGGVGITVVPLKRGYFTYQLGSSLRSNDERRALRLLMLEYERLRQVGFTQEELEAGRRQLKDELLTGYRYSIIDNEAIAANIANSFLDGEPLLSEEDNYNICSDILDRLTLQQLNDAVKQWSSGKNRTIVVTGAPNEDALTAEEVNDIVKAVARMDYSDYAYEMPQEPEKKPILAEAPRAGKVKKTTKLKDVAATQWTLSNGATVIYKPVLGDKSKVCLRAMRRGGESLFEIDDIPAAEQATTCVLSAGVGGFDSQSLYQQMQLHDISFDPSINQYSSQVVGKARPNEAESMFQLMYSYFMKPNFDEKVFNAIKGQLFMRNRSNALSDTIRMLRTNYSPRTLLRNAGYYEKLTMERVKKVWKTCFGTPSAFTFIITGNIGEEEAKALSEKYIASLTDEVKSDASMSQWRDRGIGPMPGHTTKEVEMKLGREIATVVVNFNLVADPSVKDIVSCQLLNQIFQNRCMQNIREREGGVYTINVNEETSSVPTGFYSIAAEFSCSPDDAARLRGKLVEEWKQMVKQGVSAAEYDVVKRHLTKKMREDGDKSEAWSMAIARRGMADTVTLHAENFPSLIASMSVDDVNNLLRRMDSKGNLMEVTFLSR